MPEAKKVGGTLPKSQSACSRTTRSAASKDQATFRSCALPFASYKKPSLTERGIPDTVRMAWA
jgi:hypothetical protein